MGNILGQDKAKKALEVAIAHNLPALLVGETGSGKTSIIRELASKHKKTFARFNMTGETSVDEFVGKYTLATNGKASETVWQDGILLRAMKEGHWLVVDEINVALPEITLILNSLLDDDKFVTVTNHDGEIVKCHEDFRFFATMNPTDEYSGTKELNKALWSRFPIIEEMKYPSKAIERKILVNAGVEETTASKMVDVALRIREAKSAGRVYYTCSTRDLLQWAELSKHLDLRRAFELSMLNKANNDTVAINDIFVGITNMYAEVEQRDNGLAIEEYIRKARELDERENSLRRQEEMMALRRKAIDAENAKSMAEVRAEVLDSVKSRLTEAMAYVNQA